jgi:transcription initiation factor TFIID subunit 2
MVRNAITFNGADSEVGTVAVLLRQRIKDLLSTLKPAAEKDKDKKLSLGDKKGLQGALNKLISEDM